MIMDQSKITAVLIMSECHTTEAQWTPEKGSNLYRERTPLRAKAIDRPNDPPPIIEDEYVKPMRWTKKEGAALRAWRKEFGYSMDRGGYRSTNIANVNK